MIEHYTVGDVQVCAVVTPLSTYVVEPYRLGIGVTRAAMVDQHLDELRQVADPRHPDLPVLVAARNRFRDDEHRRAA